MPQAVRKAVIAAAGYGTRFLPVTSTVPKEMLPLIDRPAIGFVVEELMESGVEEILIISSKRKAVLEKYFEEQTELKQFLQDSPDKLAKLPDFSQVDIHFLRQEKMKGTADALYLTRDFSAGDPFVVVYPDDVFFSETPVAKQLIDAFTSPDAKPPVTCAVAVEHYGQRDVSRYGVAVPRDPAPPGGAAFALSRLAEKPTGEPPSRWVSYGRYVFGAELFPVLEDLLDWQRVEGVKEVSQSPAISRLAEQSTVLGVPFEGTRRDLGQPYEYLIAMVDYALGGGLTGEARQEFISYLQSRVGK